MESVTQVESGLIYSVISLISGHRGNPTIIDISNLLTFALAMILFDKIAVPVSKGQKVYSTSEFPDILAVEDIFINETIKNFDQRKMAALELGTRIASVEHPINKHKSRYDSLLAFYRAALSQNGEQWIELYQRHVMRYFHDSGAFMKEAMKRLDHYFDDPEYAHLPPEDKIGITYIWRCIFHSMLAIDNERPYLHSAYRTPVVNAVFDNLSKQLTIMPQLSYVEGPSGILGEPAPLWSRILPSLLGRILRKIDNKKQIFEEILHVRNSKAAKAFRNHYSIIQEKFGEPRAKKAIEEDIKHLLDLWAGFSDQTAIPVSFSLFGISLSGLPKGVVLRIRRFGINVRKPYLRIIVDTMKHQEEGTELDRLLRKTFGVGIYC